MGGPVCDRYETLNLMTYALAENNAERQQVLAECLDPLTLPVLQRIPKASITRILDIGCGQGNTTRMLAEHFPDASVTGLEYDPALVAHAAAHTGNRSGVHFEQGDASRISHSDASFDLVFTRYLLTHSPDPAAVVRGMLRVARPGGYVVAFEPDASIDYCYPPHPCMDLVNYLWNRAFPHPRIGRELVPMFRTFGPSRLEAGAVIGMDHDRGVYGRFYRLTIEALGPVVEERNLMARDDYAALVAELRRLEDDPQTIYFKFPDVWVIAQP